MYTGRALLPVTKSRIGDLAMNETKQLSAVGVDAKPLPAHLSQNEIIAAHAVKSGNYKGLTYSTALMILQMADEMGLPMAQALGSMHLVDGKLVMSANLIAALVKRSGRYNYKVLEHTDKNCTIEFFEKLGVKDGLIVWDSLGKFSWNMDMAKRAGLHTKQVWLKFPENMLFSRAITSGVRTFCPDLTVVAVYDTEEAESFDKSSYKHQEQGPSAREPINIADLAKSVVLANN
jgi:hypothetical protein